VVTLITIQAYGKVAVAKVAVGWPLGAEWSLRGDRVSAPRTARASAAVAAEPLGIGSAGARDPLAAEVKLLGALLGQVIAEQAGPELFATVERIRRRTIALRRDDDPLETPRLDEELGGLALAAVEAVLSLRHLFRAGQPAETRSGAHAAGASGRRVTGSSHLVRTRWPGCGTWGGLMPNSTRSWDGLPSDRSSRRT
jgi:hypothetical protein